MADVSKALNIVRKLNPMGFFSRATEEAQRLPQAKGTGEQMRAMLLKQGVKPDELKWTGFDEWAKGKKSVTRDEITEFLRRNEVQLGEKRLSGKEEYGKWEPEAEGVIGDVRQVNVNPSPTKFEQYTLPGGKDYNELLLTAPHKKMQRVGVTSTGQIFTEEELTNPIVRRTAEKIGLTMEDRMMPTMQPYRSSHWDDPNVLAHMRMSGRTVGADPVTMADIERRMAGVTDAPSTSWGSGIAELAAARGAISPEEAATYSRSKGWHNKFKDAPGLEKRVLHLEELQSDWAQAGRKKGFVDPKAAREQWVKDNEALKEKYLEAQKQHSELADQIMLRHEPLKPFNPDIESQSSYDYRKQQYNNRRVSLLDADPDYRASAFNLDRLRGRTQSLAPDLTGTVPPAPFVESTPGWTNLLIKRALTEAARGNYDAIAWTPGKTQFARYPDPDATPEQQAKRLKGMIGYYDKMFPTQIGKVLKDINETPQFGEMKIGNTGGISGIDVMNNLPETRGMDEAQQGNWWGSLDQSERTRLTDEHRAQGTKLSKFDLTPQMREKINQGLPLFTMMPAAVGLGATASQMQEGQNRAVEGEVVGEALQAIRRNRENGGPVDMRAGGMFGSPLGLRRFAREQKTTNRVLPPSPSLGSLNDGSLSGVYPVDEALAITRQIRRPGSDDVPDRIASRPEPMSYAPVEAREASGPSHEDVARALWVIYNASENPADFVRADEATRTGRADGGSIDRDMTLSRQPFTLPRVEVDPREMRDAAEYGVPLPSRYPESRFDPRPEGLSAATDPLFTDLRPERLHSVNQDAVLRDTLMARGSERGTPVDPHRMATAQASPRRDLTEVQKLNLMLRGDATEGSARQRVSDFATGALEFTPLGALSNMLDAVKHGDPADFALNAINTIPGGYGIARGQLKGLMDRSHHKGQADGGAIEGYGDGGIIKRALQVAREYVDPPTKKIGDWKWRAMRSGFGDGGEVEEQPGLVDRALSFLSQFNPVGSAEAAPVGKMLRGMGASVAEAVRPVGKLDTILRAAKKIAAPAENRPDLFDYSRLGDVPHVRQFDLPRNEPPRGVPPRVTEMIANPDVRDEMLKTIEQGERMGGSRWYNADPLRDKFVEQFGTDRGGEAFRKYMDFVAATSPRSEVGANVRNASYYYNRAMSGQGMPPVGERNPTPYGHLAQRLHQMNAERVAGSGWDPLNNPKPASFVENLVGNQQPVTVDTHAFRLPAVIARDPRFLETAFQVSKDAPKQNIAKMIESGEISMDDAANRAAYWQAQPKANEYAALEQYYKSLGKDLGLTPAQTQAAAWVGGGARTGLKSDESKPFLRFVEDRIYKTANERNMDPQDVMKMFVRGETPLYASGGSVSHIAMMIAKELGLSPSKSK